MARFKAWVQTNKIGSRCEDTFEIDDEELEGLTDEERERLIGEYAQELLLNHYDMSWEEV